MPGIEPGSSQISRMQDKHPTITVLFLQPLSSGFYLFSIVQPMRPASLPLWIPEGKFAWRGCIHEPLYKAKAKKTLSGEEMVLNEVKVMVPWR